MVAPTRELIDALYVEEVRAARRMSAEEKLLAGPRMFEAGCGRIREQLRDAFPQAAVADIDVMLREIVRIAERRGDL
jgi:hypothetical protein